MKALTTILLLILIASCGNPTSDREGYQAGDGNRGSRGANSAKIVTRCDIFSKFESFSVSLDERNPATKRVLRNSYSESKELVEEYDFSESGYSMKAYLVSKDDGSAYNTNPQVISFDRNDKKLIRYLYNDEEAFNVQVNCSTNQPIEVEAKL